MEGHFHHVAGKGLDAELLAQLANERVARIFAGANLTARKLPRPGEVCTGLALGQEHTAPLDENRRRNEQRRRRGARCSGWKTRRGGSGHGRRTGGMCYSLGENGKKVEPHRPSGPFVF